ncbi:unnamed protein product [Paramecium pentaurelia]|uniref:Kinetochore protein NDC80 n=1 Tax=Paramecium pentaurelia TaxID=43138 RepID=A0A8S1WAW7_9CILI|nr:unnamed protein product [Paramecium pentaurelia]
MNNNRRRQSHSAERVNQQSSIKVQSEQKPPFLLDLQNEMEYIEDILILMARINRTQFQEPQQLKHALKTQNSVYLNILQLIMNVIDPYLEIKSFSDEKFQLLLKRLGYPCKHMSKTRFMSLGSSHTYLQSLHILSWLCRQAQQIIQINERIENGQYQPIEIENESFSNKIKKKLAEYLQDGYIGTIDDSALEKCYRDAKQKLTLELMQLQKDISKLTCELNVIKTQEPNLPEIEEQYKNLDAELMQVTQETQENQQILESTRQEINQNMNKYLEVDNEIIKVHKLIESKRQYIAQQPIKIDKAKEMEAKDYQLTIQSQQLLNELQKYQKEIDKARQEKTEMLCKISNIIQMLNSGKVKFDKDYETFEKNLYSYQQKLEQNNGIQIGEDENLLDMELDAQFEQKLVNEQIDYKSRKSLVAYDLIQKQDTDSILKLLLPNKEQILQDLNQQLQDILNKLSISKRQALEMKNELNQKLKQLEDIECAKKMIIQEISQLNDSTEELKVLKQIYLEHQEKQQILLKEMEQKKLEIKFIVDRKNLDVIEIDRLKKQNQENQEVIFCMQQQAEIIEEKNTQLQQQFKDWVKDNLDQFLSLIQEVKI